MFVQLVYAMFLYAKVIFIVISPRLTLAYLFVDICFLTVIAKRLNDSLRTVGYEMQPRAYTLQPNTKTKMTGDSFRNML